MAQVNWIKVSVDLFEDEKMRLIQALPEGDAITIMWVRLLTMAGKTNDSGYVYLKEGTPYTPQMLSIIWSKPQPVVELALKTFLDFGMIEINGKGIYICNWDKHQNIDGLDKIREQNRMRKQRQREKEKAIELPAPEENSSQEDMSRDGHVTVTQSHATEENRLEENRLEENRLEEKKKRKEKRPKENLSSTKDVETFVEKQMLSNPSPINRKILVKYIDCLRLYRKTARISTNIVEAEWDKWKRFPEVVVTYAMLLHVEKHGDKDREYTIGIMKRTTEHEASRKLMIMMNKQEANQNDESTTGAGSNTQPSDKPGKWDAFVYHG